MQGMFGRFVGLTGVSRLRLQSGRQFAFARVLLAASLFFNVVAVVGGGYYLFVLKGHSISSLSGVFSRIASERWFREEPEEVADSILPEIVVGSLEGFDTWTTVRQADALRHWIYSNSAKKAYIEGTTGQYNTGAVLRQLMETSRGEGEAPHLICAPRALALRALYRTNGWQVRMAHIYSDDYPEVRSHTFLEYFDPELERWVIEDPTFDITYINSKGERTTTSTLVFGETDATPVGWDQATGWEENSVSHLRDHFWEAAMISSDTGYLDGTILANPARFDAQKPFPNQDGLTFRQWAKDAYGSTSVVELVGTP